MAEGETPAIVLRRVSYGDYDVIVTLLTEDSGKRSVMAKNAKKSVKRFRGVLELFSKITAVIREGRGMPILSEASLEEPYGGIRTDYRKTAYAAYWAELLYGWLEEEKGEKALFDLMGHVLSALDSDAMPMETASILFQMKLAVESGFAPALSGCCECGLPASEMHGTLLTFVPQKGGLVCGRCRNTMTGRSLKLSKGTIKLLNWIGKSDLAKAGRVTIPPYAAREGLAFMETFIPFCLGREPKSLRVLRAIRD